jgi:hypothetical protein
VWIYRVSQEERSVFWEVTASVILSKNMYMPLPSNDYFKTQQPREMQKMVFFSVSGFQNILPPIRTF